MPENDPNDFTDREKFILSYYRSPELSGSRRRLSYDLMFAAASIGLVIYAAVREEVAFGFVGYMLLLGRLYYLVVEGGRWSQDFRSIFRKYDSKLKAATDEQKTASRNDVV